MTVRELLQQAKAAHDAYRMALPRFDPRSGQTIPGDPIDAAAHLQRAFDLRARAEHADPAGLDPMWASDEPKYPQYALLRFYDQESQKADGVDVFVAQPVELTRG